MKKTYLYTLIIFIVLLMINMVSVKTANIRPPDLFAYDPACVILPTSADYQSNLVNTFDGDIGYCQLDNYPPVGHFVDWRSWRGGNYLAQPTPKFINYAAVPDTNAPINKHGSDYLRVTWTGQSTTCGQYISLTNFAALDLTTADQGKNFGNMGCADGASFPYDVTTHAGNWQCYDYVKFYYYFNEYANAGSAGAQDVYQRASVYDGKVTRTVPDSTGDQIMVEPLGNPVPANNLFIHHFTFSLKYLANQYDQAEGFYFSTSNVADFIIHAVDADYNAWSGADPQPIEGYPGGSRGIIMYYDKLTLGVESALPEYDSPGSLSVGTYMNPLPAGAQISFDPSAVPDVTPEVPVTAFQVYRSLNTGTGGDPFIPVGITKSATPVPSSMFFVDTSCPGDDTFCYKVLTCNNGPNPLATVQRANTVNATYHQPLLAQVTQVCGWVDPVPSPTFTVTWTPDLTVSSPTPTATIDYSNAIAWVYPNPYNPKGDEPPFAGSGSFYVGGVEPGSSVEIYSMDGMLVKRIEDYNAGAGRFVWNGTNQNGKDVVSGLYFLVITPPDGSEGQQQIFRVIVCYTCDPVYSP